MRSKTLSAFWFRSACVAAFMIFACGGARAQFDNVTVSPFNTILTIHVRAMGGDPIPVQATVRLKVASNPNSPAETATSLGGGLVIFHGVAPGQYIMEATAKGYETTSQNLWILDPTNGANTIAFITMRSLNDGTTAETRLTYAAALKGNVHKEMDLATAALNANKPAEAEKHIQNVLKQAPTNPDAQYLAALCDQATKNSAGEKLHLEAAIAAQPNHAGAQMTLGELLLTEKDYPVAIQHLEMALSLDPDSWRGHWMLAQAVVLGTKDYAKAKFHAGRAVELGKSKAAGADIILAIAEERGGDLSGGRATLENYLKDYPQDPGAAQARTLLGSAEFANSTVPGSVQLSIPVRAPTGSGVLDNIQPGSLLRLPSGIDDAIPPVASDVACSLPQVLEGAARRVDDFTVALERFSATENVVHDELTTTGVTKRSYQHSFQYLVALEHPRPDVILLDEMRDGRFALEDFPAPLAAGGIPAMALVFHSDYQKDFTFTCEGLGNWRGQPAWQVHFAQRADRPARIHGWVVAGNDYPAHLKGRAWISSGDYHILRIETDLMTPIPEIHLSYEHMAIEYGPEKFPSGKKDLWLPVSALVYSRYKGQFFRQQHDFTNFVLFDVGASQSSKDPVKH